MSSFDDKLLWQLDRDEGRIPHAYRDHLGYLTIGVGHLVDPRKKAGLSNEVIDLQLKLDIQEKTRQVLSALPWASNLDHGRLGALINMCFQLGINGLMQFKKTLAHLKAGRWQEAHDEALKCYTSLDGDEWPEQTPERAKRVAKQLLTGEWQ